MFFAVTLASLEFGKPRFWLAMILVGQKLAVNQLGPTKLIAIRNIV
jgi:hypothetical protein